MREQKEKNEQRQKSDVETYRVERGVTESQKKKESERSVFFLLVYCWQLKIKALIKIDITCDFKTRFCTY